MDITGAFVLKNIIKFMSKTRFRVTSFLDRGVISVTEYSLENNWFSSQQTYLLIQSYWSLNKEDQHVSTGVAVEGVLWSFSWAEIYRQNGWKKLWHRMHGDTAGGLITMERGATLKNYEWIMRSVAGFLKNGTNNRKLKNVINFSSEVETVPTSSWFRGLRLGMKGQPDSGDEQRT